jgi:hypothetical protein
MPHPHIIDLILQTARRRPGKDRVKNIKDVVIEVRVEINRVIGRHEEQQGIVKWTCKREKDRDGEDQSKYPRHLP